MIKWIGLFLNIIFFTSLAYGNEPTKKSTDYWPQWRGPFATGVAPNADPPIEWNEGQNIRWKIDLPGKGHAAPVIWDNQIFILTAIGTDKPGDPEKIAQAEKQSPRWMRRRRNHVQPTHVQKFEILSIDRNSGKILWQKTAREEHPHEGTHRSATWASNSPVTDGEHVFAHFGSRGLYCYDMQGKLIWQTDLGEMTTRNSFGEGSSPALYEDTIVINWDHEGDSFIVALDKNSGKELWKKERDEVTSWSTPIIVEVNGKPQVIINASARTRGYDLKTGDIIWEIGGMTTNTIPSPVYEQGVVYVMSGYKGSMLQAIRLAEATGDLSNSDAVLWTHDRDTPYVPAPLLYDEYLYFLKVFKGILSCLDSKSGKAYFGPQRLDGIQNIYSPPVGAQDRIYITGRDGTTLVIKKGAEFEILASNHLNDTFDAGAAIVGKELYLRGHDYLYSIANE